MQRYRISSFQKNFVINELMVLAWAASVQRADVYKAAPNPADSQVLKFRKGVFNFIQDLIPQYVNGCDEQTHIENLQALVDHATAMGSPILAGKVYRIGVAQKLLNLVLKYIWCSGFIAKPPHCPVDRIVLKMGEASTDICWTQMRSMDEYLLAIRELRRRADAELQLLADWELTHYRRRAGDFLDVQQVTTVRDTRLAIFGQKARFV